MFNIQDRLGDKDLSNERLIVTDGGEKLTAKRTDPYGMWHIEWPVDKIKPKIFDQSFTDFSKLEEAVGSYLANKINKKK